MQLIASRGIGPGRHWNAGEKSHPLRTGRQRRSPDEGTQLAFQRAGKGIERGKLRPRHLRPFQIQLPPIVLILLLLRAAVERPNDLADGIELFQVCFGRPGRRRDQNVRARKDDAGTGAARTGNVERVSDGHETLSPQRHRDTEKTSNTRVLQWLGWISSVPLCLCGGFGTFPFWAFAQIFFARSAQIA